MRNAYNLHHRNEAIPDIARAMQLELAELPEFPLRHRIKIKNRGMIYCLPLIIVQMRRYPRRARITLVKPLLGWTVLGWIGALVWSASPARSDRS